MCVFSGAQVFLPVRRPFERTAPLHLLLAFFIMLLGYNDRDQLVVAMLVIIGGFDLSRTRDALAKVYFESERWDIVLQRMEMYYVYNVKGLERERERDETRLHLSAREMVGSPGAGSGKLLLEALVSDRLLFFFFARLAYFYTLSSGLNSIFQLKKMYILVIHPDKYAFKL